MQENRIKGAYNGIEMNPLSTADRAELLARLDISRSNGRGKHGQTYYYVRPAEECGNKSHRVRADKLNAHITRHWPTVKYFRVENNGWVVKIGAKDAKAALKEFARIEEIGADLSHVKIEEI